MKNKIQILIAAVLLSAPLSFGQKSEKRTKKADNKVTFEECKVQQTYNFTSKLLVVKSNKIKPVEAEVRVKADSSSVNISDGADINISLKVTGVMVLKGGKIDSPQFLYLCEGGSLFTLMWDEANGMYSYGLTQKAGKKQSPYPVIFERYACTPILKTNEYQASK